MLHINKLLVAGILLVAPMVAAAELFVYELPDGSRVLTDQISADPEYRLVQSRRADQGVGLALAGKNRQAYRPNRKAYDKLIAKFARNHDVEGSLIKAVIHAESHFNPYATSPKGAAGLMQLMPATAHEYGVDNIYDPAQNLEAGVLHLRYLLRRYRNTKLAVAAYNAGQSNVDRYNGVPPYEETRSYVRKVLKFSKMYETQFDNID